MSPPEKTSYHLDRSKRVIDLTIISLLFKFSCQRTPGKKRDLERMCNKSGGTDHQDSMCTKEISFSPAPARKTRTKTRKPKFLSLRQELSEENSQESGEMTDHGDQQQQLNLFPLHPENLFGEKDIQDENMSYFFDADSGATLNGLLDGKSGGIGDSVLHSEEDSFSPSLTYAFGEHDGEEVACSLVRTALRHKERHAGEEKWVVYSQVVEKKEEEVSSCGAHVWLQNQTQLLSLKLDYQEILNAWSDKGPLFIETDSPQIVPDVHDDCQAQDSTSASHQVRRVPEGEEEGSSVSAMEEVVSGGEGWKRTGQREARVLRYKEKRQSRLFSKRIRYEVRKINAEKRPRIKGRFVKRS